MAAPPPPAGGVVIEHKKGEVNELKASLRNPAIDRDPEKKREVIKRVIAYMTLGIDVSKLFSEMIMAVATKDHVVKKMVYLYVGTYAPAHPELALLAINTLQKDCRDEDPMTRGLALRSFTSLRLPNIVEYLPQQITAGLQDQSPYVRKTAVIGCIKLFLVSPEAVTSTDLVDTLYKMLRDRDPQVVANCICALDEILKAEGGMVINKQIIHHLLNRMKEFNEWSQCIVLDKVARYKPAQQQEIFDIMNLLEERLKHSNSAVVLACTKVFLNLTQDMPEVHKQVYSRLKAPMLTLMTGGVFEQGFTCLKHISLLTQRAPEVFSADFKHFYCRYNDPACVKLLKLEILTAVATAENMHEAVEEIAEYVTDPDTNVARGAVNAIGGMGVKVPSCSGLVVDQLMKFLEVDIDHVSAEAVLAMRDLLRKYPDCHERIVGGVGALLKNIDEPEAKVALLWMLGEYGQKIPESPYLLEPLIDGFNEEQSQAVRLELLAAATKLFFKRPAELQHMLGRLLEAAIADASFTDVHDRAMMYYRMLQHDVQAACQVLTKTGHVAGLFVEEAPSELQDRIFEEFNTLSVIYGEPAERFVTHAAALASAKGPPVNSDADDEPAPAPAPAPAAAAAADDDDDDSDDSDDDEDDAPAPAPAPAAPPPMDLLGGLMDDLAPAPAPAAAAALLLTPGFALDAGTFQQHWTSLPVSDTWALPCAAPVVPEQLQARMGAEQIKCMAFGGGEDTKKFYFFAQEANARATLLVELVVTQSTRQATATVKGTVPPLVPLFSDRLKKVLASF